MLEEISKLVGLTVYTNDGINLGSVRNVLLDITNDKIDGLFVAETNSRLVDGSRNVKVPYRWVQAIGDVVLLRYFPGKVSAQTSETEESDAEEEEEAT